MGRSLLHEGVTDVSDPPRAEGPRERRLFSLDEAAQYLGLGSRWAVRRLVVKGALPVVKIARKWRLDVEDLNNLIATLKVGDTNSHVNSLLRRSPRRNDPRSGATPPQRLAALPAREVASVTER
jgi:excisionase family DNA binding protein